MKTKMIAHINDVLYMKCEWLKNESNYFVIYFRLILQPEEVNSLKRLQDQPKVLTSYKIIRLIL